MRTPAKTALAAAALLIAGALGLAAPTRPAFANDLTIEGDVSFFFGALAPHGDWIQVQPYGWAWVPDEVGYGWRPYTVGQWAWVEPYGWTWVSDEPWGWATYHYGRWAYLDDYGWAWIPGTTWASAWVAFRYGDPWVGWAPLPPGPNYRYDAAFDGAAFGAELAISPFAWTFVSLQFFAEPGVHTHALVSAYNPDLLRRTAWSTRFAAVDGGVANVSVDLAAAERARRAPIPRRRLQLAASADAPGARLQADTVTLFRPRILSKAPTVVPPPRARGASAFDLDAWSAKRKAAIQAFVDGQRQALEHPDAGVVLPAPTPPAPGMATGNDAAQRRDAALRALEEERKRVEMLFERQRRRRELELAPPPPPPTKTPPPTDGGHGMGDGHGMK